MDDGLPLLDPGEVNPLARHQRGIGLWVHDEFAVRRTDAICSVLIHAAHDPRLIEFRRAPGALLGLPSEIEDHLPEVRHQVAR